MTPTEQLAFFLAQANRALCLDRPDVAQARLTLRLATFAVLMGADVNASLDFNLRPLHLACRAHAQISRRCIRNSPESVELIEELLLAGADPLARDRLPQGRINGQLACGMMPAAWCEGYTPEALHNAMEALAAKGTWPEVNPDNQYDDDETRPIGSGVSRVWNFVPAAKVKKHRSKKKNKMKCVVEISQAA
jgi:hypothetical protein